MEHVGVRDDNVPCLADLAPGVTRGVAIVGERSYVDFQRRDQPVQFLQLVLREGLRRKEVKRACIRLFEDGLEDRQVVAEGFPRRRGRDDDDVAPLQDGAERLRRCVYNWSMPRCWSALTSRGSAVRGKGA
jgi:hypothetical protein